MVRVFIVITDEAHAIELAQIELGRVDNNLGLMDMLSCIGVDTETIARTIGEISRRQPKEQQ